MFSLHLLDKNHLAYHSLTLHLPLTLLTNKLTDFKVDQTTETTGLRGGHSTIAQTAATQSNRCHQKQLNKFGAVIGLEFQYNF